MNAAAPSGARYEVLDLLGEGGHASVYRVRDRTSGNVLAMKVLLPQFTRDPELLERFAAEADALKRLRHPNIVTVFDIGGDERWPFFTMELIDGPTLAELVASGQGLPADVVLSLMKGLCSAIDHLHRHRLVHRDIKAANVMLGYGGRVVLMDLGIARLLDRKGHTRDGASLGTPEAMSPEQVRGEPVGPAADIYSTGILAYQLLAGEPPFSGDTGAVLHAHAYGRPPPLQIIRPDLPPAIYDAVERALAKDPAGRPATATDFAIELAGGYIPEPVPVEIEVQNEGPPQRTTNPRMLFGIMLAAIIFALLLSLAISLVAG